MKGHAAMLAVLLLSGAGCDAGPEPEQKVRAITVANPLQDRLMALTALNQGLALRRAIQDSGSRCKKVDEHGFRGDYQALKMWNVRCSDRNDYALFIAPSGDVQVRTCADAATLGLPACTFAAKE